jgi:hypothetical protein
MKILVAVKQGAALIKTSNSRRRSRCGSGLGVERKWGSGV